MPNFLSILSQVLVLTSVYALGRFNFCFGWVLPLIYSSILDHSRHERSMHRAVIQATASIDEQEVISARLGEFPAWVLFPDVERAEWVNTIIKLLWPFLKHVVEQIVMELQVEINKHELMKNFKFTKIDLGFVTPRITGVKVQEKSSSPNELMVDVDFIYFGDCEFSFSVNGFEGGIKNLQMDGQLRVVAKLVPIVPLISGFDFSFLKCPKFIYELTTILAPLNMFALSDLLHAVISEQITNRMVFPNKITVKTKKIFRLPKIEDVFRVEVHSIEDFEEFEGHNAAVSLYLGPQVVDFEETTIENGSTPVNFGGDFIKFVKGENAVNVRVNIVYDEETTEAFTGSIEFENLHHKTHMPLVIPLQPSGSITLDAFKMRISSERKDLHAVHDKSCAILEVFIDSIRKRPHSQHHLTLQLRISNQKREISDESSTYRQNFIFFLQDPENDVLTVHLVDATTPKNYGQFDYHISELVLHKNMHHKLQAFPLLFNSDRTEIIMSLRLKALKSPK